jgi:hypothetical protein
MFAYSFDGIDGMSVTVAIISPLRTLWRPTPGALCHAAMREVDGAAHDSHWPQADTEDTVPQ